MKKALIVVDVQNDFVDGSLGSKEAREIIANIEKEIEAWDGDVFATLDHHGSDYLSTAEGKRLPIPHCIYGTQGYLHPKPIEDALKKSGYTPVTKTTFGSVDLPMLLKDQFGYKDGECIIRIIGICTDICVVSNAMILKASFPQSQIEVNSKCCAGTSPESHLNALKVMECCQIDIIY